MNKYYELKEESQKKINDFPMGFAITAKQFEEVKKKLNVKSNDELLRIFGNGFIRKSDQEAYTKLMDDIHKETEEAMKDDEYLFQGFLYELGNHEYCITYDPEDTLSCFGLTVKDLEADERLSTIFLKARKKYLSNHNW